MIHYHGTPISGSHDQAARFLSGRHAFVSFADKKHLGIVMEYCQSFALDNGAFSVWKSGKQYDFKGFQQWANEIKFHPSFDFAVIPDVIDGTEQENDALIDEWKIEPHFSAPVFHMHERLSRLQRLCAKFHRVCIGSSGKYAIVGSQDWFNRMYQIFAAICELDGRVLNKIHGLRMLNPEIFTKFPFASADSTNVAQNVNNHSRFSSMYSPATFQARAHVLADRIESYQSSPIWERKPIQENFFESETLLKVG